MAAWCAAPAADFVGRLESRFARVQTLEVPLLPGRRGDPDVVILASRAERLPASAGAGTITCPWASCADCLVPGSAGLMT